MTDGGNAVCAQCDKCVCSWCLLDGAHIGETCENLPLYVENRQGKLRERMAALEGVTAQMDAYGEALAEQPGQLAGWAEKQREQIAAHFAQLRAAMDEREEMLTQRVEEVERQLKEDSRDRTTALERTLLSVCELSLTCGQVLDHPNPCKCFTTCSTLPQRSLFWGVSDISLVWLPRGATRRRLCRVEPAAEQADGRAHLLRVRPRGPGRHGRRAPGLRDLGAGSR